MVGETHQIVDGNYNSEKEVIVKFIKTVETSTEQAYSEQDVLNTIASLEQEKINMIAMYDEKIAKNNQMLLKIRAIERPINTVE